MDKENEKKKGGGLEKVIMGAVIGGAIGSVIGAKMTPAAKREAKKEITDTVKRATSGTVKVFKWVKRLIDNKKKIPYEEAVNNKNEK